MIRPLLSALLLILAAEAPIQPAPEGVSEAALFRHIAVLADDALQGRKPGTPGAEKAVRYIAGAMEAGGLRPGADGGSWFQPVELVERRAASWRLTAEEGKMRLPIAPEEAVLVGRSRSVRLHDAPLIFGGYGSADSFADVDPGGAVILLLPGKPPGAPDLPALEARRAMLARRGAAAAIILVRGDAALKAIRGQYAEGRTMLEGSPGTPVEGALGNTAWTRLAAGAGRDAAALIAAAARPDFRAVALDARVALRVRTAIRRYTSANVVGRIEGRTRGGEAVVYTAHWDHLGICRAASVKDRICNGAVDNASGVALMLEVARGLAKGPAPDRTILIVATTGEEMGLLGARAFVARPPASVKSIVADINLDTVAISPAGNPIAVIGRGMTPLDPLVDSVAAALGRKVDATTAGNVYVPRQDGWEFMKAGIPAVMAGGAFADQKRLDAYFASHYHAPSDDVAHGIELGGAAEDGAFLIALGRALADPARFPAPAR